MKKNVQMGWLLGVLLVLATAFLNAITPNTVVATINVGINPAGMAFSPDGKTAYVVNSNNYGLPGGDTVSVLNLTNNTLEHTIFDASFNEPYAIAVSRDGAKAYVANSNGSTVTIIDTMTNEVIGMIDGFDGPSGIVINRAGTLAYVNNYGGPEGVGSGNATTVRIVDLRTDSIVGDPIVVGLAPAALALSPNGRFLYVINYVDGNPGTGTMSVIDTRSAMVADTIAGFSGPFAVAITPNGRFAYVTNFGSNNFSPIGTTVSVVNLQQNAIVDTVDVAIQPSGIAITPDSRFAYVTNYNTLYAGSNFTQLTAGQGTVNVIDLATNKIIPPTISIDQSPHGVAISPNGEYAYVANYIGNTVNVIAMQSFQITAQGCRLKRKCLKNGEYVNKLSWHASGSSLPVSYSLYRDAGLTDFVATISANGLASLKYFDSIPEKQAEYFYYLVGTNGVGTTSEPVEIVVARRCKKCK